MMPKQLLPTAFLFSPAGRTAFPVYSLKWVDKMSCGNSNGPTTLFFVLWQLISYTRSPIMRNFISIAALAGTLIALSSAVQIDL